MKGAEQIEKGKGKEFMEKGKEQMEKGKGRESTLQGKEQIEKGKEQITYSEDGTEREWVGAKKRTVL